MTRLILALAVALTPVRAEPVEEWVNVTFYSYTGSRMFNGEWPTEGDAACSWNYELGTRVTFPDAVTVTCRDRGMLGWSGWVDAYCESEACSAWARQWWRGTWVTVERVGEEQP